MGSHVRLAVLTAAVLCLAVAAWPEDYAQWRGPDRTGISSEKGLLRQWPEGGPKLVWQVTDIGFGFGSPAVAGNRVYLVSNKGLEEEYVQALDASTGKRIWATPLGKVGNPDQRPNNPGARSTPTLDGKMLYALGSDGDLACLEAETGKIVWRKSYRSDLGGVPGRWAYAESPLIDGDRLVCAPGGADATLAALNKATGEVIWKCAVPGGDSAAYASITIVTIGGVRQAVAFLDKGVVGVEAPTGKFLWRFDKSSGNTNISTPVWRGDLIYSAGGRGAAAVARVKAEGGAFAAEAVYESRTLPNSIGGFVLIGGDLYGTTPQALVCADLATGNVKWQDPCIGAGSVTCADGLLYVHGENGAVALVEASPDGYREKGRFTPPNPPERRGTKAWSYPVVANGRLYIRDMESLYCYDVKAPR